MSLSRLIPGPTRRAYANDPDNSGIIVVVGATGFIQMMVSTLTTVMGGKDRFKFARSMDDAVRLVQQARADRGE